MAVSEASQLDQWLTIVGMSEEGFAGLSASARSMLSHADCVIGAPRHLERLPADCKAERVSWPHPFADAITLVRRWQHRPVVVLASGDPFEYGIATQLAREFPRRQWLCIPAPSAFSLACSRLGWTRQHVKTLSFCGRPLAPLVRALQPNQRILALSADASTPAAVAECLRDRGFGPSIIHVLESMGGARERVITTTASEFRLETLQPLNVVGIEVRAAAGARVIPLVCGLNDDLFEHDGQITKREIRAITLSALAPRAGELLWDVGCGSGSISIEWLMSHDANLAIGIESNGERAHRAARNALALGTPHLQIVQGTAPDALKDLPTPDAIFLGGGASIPELIESAWQALRSGGRLVANAVAVETASSLLEAQRKFGGTLSRYSLEHLEPLGRFHAFRPAFAVTQWRAEKA
jgi:precorrin-6Y C5,15-methyltransferase (decarboxylating)